MYEFSDVFYLCDSKKVFRNGKGNFAHSVPTTDKEMIHALG
jgi:hypothetical protein